MQVPSVGTTSSVGTQFRSRRSPTKTTPAHQRPLGELAWDLLRRIKPRGLCNPANFGLSAVSGELRAGAGPRQDPGTTSTPIGQNTKEQRHLMQERRTEGRHGPWLSLPSRASFLPLASQPSGVPWASQGFLLFLLDPGLCPSWETFCK